ncbi:MAG: N-acetylmuramoyl-L-alanine amidase [Armatimonadota bacterium]|nr:N-acetylmuramoyl-L-alanine amidase [Armatimonadota bacterium]
MVGWLVLSLALAALTKTAHCPGAVPDARDARWVASPNFNPRTLGKEGMDVVVLHSTCTATNDTEETVRLFQSPESQVSSHYVVGKDGEIVQMVSERDRAWHAGACRWQGRTDINSCSIGIELVHQDQNPTDDWPDAQMEAVARLLLDIRSRHRIPNDHVIFHSECAWPLGRKTDPQNFDRPRLLRRVAELAIESNSRP